MPFVFPTKNASPSIQDDKSKDELFEIFMIEIGQYKLVDGNIHLCGEYIPSNTLNDKFKDWLKSKS